MSLYFGNFVTTISTLMVFLAIVFIMYSVIKRGTVQYWGRRTAFLGLFGLVLCCFVAMRDGYDKSVQAFFDTTITAGVFSLESLQSNLCCIGGAIITFSSFSSILVKNQKYRKVMFFLLSATILAKVLVIEISRLVILI